MKLSKMVAGLALLLAVALTAGYARAAGNQTAHEKNAAREAARRIALTEHERRKEDVTRRCAKPLNTRAELEACQAAYRRL
jgi:hypothetical protein